MMKNQLFKFLLTCSGILFAILTIEIAIRVYHYKINSPSTYLSPLISNSTHELDSKNGYDRNTTAEVFGTETNSKGSRILAMGDSFTNGGNLRRDFSYPQLLYKEFSGAKTVINLGVCESSSHDTLEYFKKINDKIGPLNSNDFVLLLTGATDLFAISKKKNSISSIASNLRSKQKLKLFSSSKTPYFLNFLNQLASFRLLNKAWMEYSLSKALPEFKWDKEHFNKLEYFFQSDQFGNCVQKEKLESNCYLALINQQSIKTRKVILDFLLHRTIAIKGFMAPELYTYKIKDILNFAKHTAPELEDFMLVDITATLLFIVQNQSEILLTDVKLQLEEISASYHSSGKKVPYFDYSLKAINQWNESKKQLNSITSTNLSNVIELVRANGATPILMTYPLPYKRVNKIIKQVAASENVTLIDLRKVFLLEQEQSDKLLTVDYQHSTATGNKVIAKVIKNTIIKIESASK